MRKLSKRERNLVIATGGTIFVVLNLFGISTLLRKQGEFETRRDSLREEYNLAQGWLADKDMWQQRKAWLDKTQPKMISAGEANAQLLEALTTGAAKHSIAIIEQGFVDPQPHPDFQEAAVKLKVSGTLEAITRWLVEIQQPANFQAVPSVSMKLDNDPSKIDCEITVARYYSLQTAPAAPPQQ